MSAETTSEEESVPRTGDGDGGEPDLVAPVSDRRRARGTWSRRVAMAAVLILLAAAAGFSTWGADRAQRVEDAREEALSAARTRVPALLSYQASTLDDDLSVAIEQTTGPFRDDYSEVLSTVVAPMAEERGISTQAEVAAAGVVTTDDDEVVVLVLLTQTTTARGQRPTTSGSRVEVTMTPDGPDWKIAGLQPK
jgi:Mce-associated membrane protein